jgi:hypothetical protein
MKANSFIIESTRGRKPSNYFILNFLQILHIILRILISGNLNFEDDGEPRLAVILIFRDRKAVNWNCEIWENPITGHMQVTYLVIIASELENLTDTRCYILLFLCFFAKNIYFIALIFRYAFKSDILQVGWLCQQITLVNVSCFSVNTKLKKNALICTRCDLTTTGTFICKLFSTSINHKLEIYVSAVPKLIAKAVDVNS